MIQNTDNSDLKKLTDRQQEILDFIENFIDSHSYPPTMREIADHFDFSVKAGYDHVKAIEKKGYIRLNGNLSRTIEVLHGSGQNDDMLKIPLLGHIAAGEPIFSKANYDGEVELPTTMFRAGEFFALNVRGDSMKDAGILDGDIAVIRKQNIAQNGEIVVAMVPNLEESYTLKRFYKEKTRIRLQPANKAYSPKYTKDAMILGKLACVIRLYE